MVNAADGQAGRGADADQQLRAFQLLGRGGDGRGRCRRFVFGLAAAVQQQLGQFGQRLFSVLAGGFDAHFVALAGGQAHHADHGLGVGGLFVQQQVDV